MSALEDKLYDYFLPCLEVPANKFVEAHADITRPKKPYVSFQLLGEDTIGVTHGAVDDDGMMPINHVKTINVQLMFYGDNAQQDAELFKMKLEMESSLIRGEQLNFGLLSIAPAVDTSAEMAKTWERRYPVRLTLSHSTMILDDVGLIDTVEIGSDFFN